MKSASIACVLLLFGRTAFCQDAPELRARHVTLGAGVNWSGAYDVGDATARLRGNASGAAAPPFTLFTADSRMTTATAPDFRVGFAVTPRLAIEGGVSFAQPRIAIAIAGDAEVPSQELIGEKLDQYQIDAGLAWQIPIRIAREMAPFVSAGGAYLRQLHEDRALAETGRLIYVGTGARYWLRGGHGASKAIGVRADLRVNRRTHGIDFENKQRTYPSVSLMLFVGL